MCRGWWWIWTWAGMPCAANDAGPVCQLLETDRRLDWEWLGTLALLQASYDGIKGAQPRRYPVDIGNLYSTKYSKYFLFLYQSIHPPTHPSNPFIYPSQRAKNGRQHGAHPPAAAMASPGQHQRHRPGLPPRVHAQHGRQIWFATLIHLDVFIFISTAASLTRVLKVKSTVSVFPAGVS